MIRSNSVTLESFIERASIKHNNKYEYHCTLPFNNTLSVVNILCPVHGLYSQQVKAHLAGRGCHLCGNEERNKKQSIFFDEFIERIPEEKRLKHSYNELSYTGFRSKMEITCLKHNLMFLQAPGTHIKGTVSGCSECRREHISSILSKNNLKYTTEEIIQQSKNIWGDNRWDYTKFVYVGKQAKSTFICNDCNIEFEQRIMCHLDKANGCPGCQTKYGWKRTDWINYCKSVDCKYPIVYFMNCKNETEEFIKIGFSSKVKRRLKDVPYNTFLINSIFGKPGEIYDLENKLHRIFKQYQYVPQISFKGETECFNLNILQDKNFQFFLQ